MKAVEPARIVFLDRDTMPADISLRPFAFPYELTEFSATKLDQMALSVLAYNLTRVMNIVGTKPLMAAIAA